MRIATSLTSAARPELSMAMANWRRARPTSGDAGLRIERSDQATVGELYPISRVGSIAHAGLNKFIAQTHLQGIEFLAGQEW